jgi:hypothetical protein
MANKENKNGWRKKGLSVYAEWLSVYVKWPKKKNGWIKKS